MNKKIMLLGLVMLFALSSIAYAVPDENNETFIWNTCPNDTTQDVFLFIGIGFFMLAMLWFSEKLIRIPFFTIMVGIGFIAYSLVMMGCHITLGLVILSFGVGVVLFKWFFR